MSSNAKKFCKKKNETNRQTGKTLNGIQLMEKRSQPETVCPFVCSPSNVSIAAISRFQLLFLSQKAMQMQLLCAVVYTNTMA